MSETTPSGSKTLVDAILPRKQVIWAIVAVVFIQFVYYIVYAGLSPALPKISADLNGLALYAWATSLPALTGAFATLIYGKLGDTYGRRPILVASMLLFLVGSIGCALSTSFVMWLVFRAVIGLGHGALAPLCFSVIGDCFNAVGRARWGGLLAIPAVVGALIGPIFTGLMVDGPGWRAYFWVLVPLVVIAGALVWLGVPSLAQKMKHNIDYLGAGFLMLAMSTMLVAFSFAGSTWSWGSPQVLGLLGTSIILWIVFLRIESKAEEPMLNPMLLKNRVFMTASIAGMVSFFGLSAVISFFPLFVQGVQGLSAAVSGQIMTPYQVLVRSLGLVAGLAMAKWHRYKWMYLVCYGIIPFALFGMARLTATTPVIWDYLLVALAGLGLGFIPTVNTLVCQNALPKRMIGQATSGVYFFVFLGSTMCPAILGTILNSRYAKAMAGALPAAAQGLDSKVLASLNNPRVLLNKGALETLQNAVAGLGGDTQGILNATVDAVRNALQTGLAGVFIAGMIGLIVSLIIIVTIPEIPLADAADPGKAAAKK